MSISEPLRKGLQNFLPIRLDLPPGGLSGALPYPFLGGSHQEGLSYCIYDFIVDIGAIFI